MTLGKKLLALYSLVVVAALLVSCAPASAPVARDGAAPEAPRSTPTQLQIGMLLENQPVGAMTTYGRGLGLGGREHYYVFHANLTQFDPNTSDQLPSVATKVPRIQDGDWVLLPAGGMEVTFKIRPNVVWHDGTPLAAEDFVFGFQVATDPALPTPAAQLRPIAEIRAADPQTVVIVWKEFSPFGDVNANEGVPALPRHILQDLYVNDKTSFENSPFWKEEWIGLGPYRLTRWEFGSFMEGSAFDQYFAGRPKIDRVRINYVGDANALIANLFAGTVDVIPSGAGLDVADQVIIRDRCKASGTQGTFYPSLKGVQSLSFQFRNPTPWAQDVRVRQALISFLNRDLLADSQTEGAVPRADFLLLDRDPVYKEAVAQRLPTYPYDPARAERLLAEAGWARTPAGGYRNTAGEDFPQFDVAGNQGSDNVRRQAAVANMWSTAGIPSEPRPFTASRGLELAQETATFPAVVFRNWILGFLSFNRLAQAEIGTENNRWTGNNYGGWTNPAYQDLLGKFNTTADATARRGLAVGLVQLHAEQVPVIPLWFSGNPAVVRPGLSGPGEVSPEVPATMWNIYTWEMK